MVAFVGPNGQWVDQPDQSQGAVSGGGIPFRASRTANVYGNAGIIDAMQADTALWHVWMFGDSRTAGIVNSKFVARAPVGVALGGVQLFGNTASVAGMNVGQPAGVTADALGTSPYIGYLPNPITRYEFQTATGTTPAANNTITRRLVNNTNLNVTTFAPALWARLNGRQSWLKGVARMSPDGWSSGAANMPSIHLHARPIAGAGLTSDAGYMVSQPVPTYRPDGIAYTIGGVQFPAAFDWATHTSPEFGWIVQGNVAVATAGKMVAVSGPWLELPTGFLMRETGCVGGRSIVALTNEEILPTSTWAVAKMCGKPVLWVEIGTNNTPSYSQATFRQQLELVIARYRAGVEDSTAPVILVTAYAASSDTVAPYYVLAAREIAQADKGVVCLDTWAQLPSYAVGNGLGYYSDTVHYNSTGNDAFADAYWTLWTTA